MAMQRDMAGAGHYNTPDYSGLQYDDRGGAPGLEVVDHQTRIAHPEGFHKFELTPPPAEPPPDVPDKKPSSKRLWILLGIGVAVVIIAVVVGCVVGLVVVPNSRKAESSPSSSEPGGGASANGSTGSTRRSACRRTVCPQILSVAQLDTRVMVFGRGVDNDIWYHTASVDAISSWPDNRQWISLKGGPFISQPSAMSWAVNGTGRISVAAVSDPSHTAFMRHFSASTSTWTSGWQNQFGRFSSPVSLCVVDRSDRRLDGWAIEGGKVLHNYYLRDRDNFYSPGLTSAWQDPGGIPETGIVAQPGIACRRHAHYHDVFLYSGTTGLLKHTAFSDTGGWLPLATYDGGPEEGFQGAPTVLATGPRRTDFFGVGKDGAMYHGVFSEDAGHPRLTNLGGAFQSVAAAVRTASGRVDVVALGAGDTLLHRVLVGDQWLLEWEDLGVFGNSAPAVANFTTTPETVGVYVLGVDGEVNATVWTVGQELSWKGLKWTSMGGNLTTGFMRS